MFTAINLTEHIKQFKTLDFILRGLVTSHVTQNVCHVTKPRMYFHAFWGGRPADVHEFQFHFTLVYNSMGIILYCLQGAT